MACYILFFFFLINWIEFHYLAKQYHQEKAAVYISILYIYCLRVYADLKLYINFQLCD